MLHLLREAAKAAVANDPNDKRNFILGAIGVRQDGVMVSAKNGAVISSTFDEYRIISDAHAECRVIRKLGKFGIIYVSRVLKKDGTLAMARPCGGCQIRILAAKVRKVYYSIDEYHYGVYDPNAPNADRIYEVSNEQERIRRGNREASPRLYLPGAA
jgi:tRNA(Arg) A34 adenosine deaminase TadA